MTWAAILVRRRRSGGNKAGWEPMDRWGGELKTSPRVSEGEKEERLRRRDRRPQRRGELCAQAGRQAGGQVFAAEPKPSRAPPSGESALEEGRGLLRPAKWGRAGRLGGCPCPRHCRGGRAVRVPLRARGPEPGQDAEGPGKVAELPDRRPPGRGAPAARAQRLPRELRGQPRLRLAHRDALALRARQPGPAAARCLPAQAGPAELAAAGAGRPAGPVPAPALPPPGPGRPAPRLRLRQLPPPAAGPGAPEGGRGGRVPPAGALDQGWDHGPPLPRLPR